MPNTFLLSFHILQNIKKTHTHTLYLHTHDRKKNKKQKKNKKKLKYPKHKSVQGED